MKNLDYIIVGCGLAGISFCEILKQHHKSFLVIDDGSQNTSTVAGGLYNPVVLKRFTKAWEADKQLGLALLMYQRLEKILNVTLDYKTPVYRLFNSVEEQNNWFQASDKPVLSNYLSPQIVKEVNPNIQNEFGFGKVLQSGRIDTALLIKSYKKHLKENNQLLETSFNHNKLKLEGDSIGYDDYMVKQLVFAEGFGLKHNPFFNYLPLKGTKGELLTIHAPDLKLEIVLKSSVFLIPLGNDLYRIGATYNWEDKTTNTTDAAKAELLSKLERFLTCNYKVMDHLAGIRPTVIDRRPLVGKHPKYERIFVLNGLGTRGVMIAPYVAKQLFNSITLGHPLDAEIDVKRFEDLLLG